MGERRRQVAVSIGLGEQGIGLGLKGLHSVGTRSEAHGRFREPGKLHERGGKLGGISILFAVHASPGCDGLLGAFGIIVDGGLRISGGAGSQQICAEET
jgi:hypothetical protein